MNKKLKNNILNLSISQDIDIAICEWVEDGEFGKQPYNSKCEEFRELKDKGYYPCICGYPVKMCSIFSNTYNGKQILVSSGNRRQCCIKYFPNKREMRKTNKSLEKYSKISDSQVIKLQNEFGTSERIYFNIPYDDKEEAKSLNCLWDPYNKKWYLKDFKLIKDVLNKWEIFNFNYI